MPRSRSITQILLRGARRRARRVFKPDNLGNVVAYADAGGSVIAAYAYDAFGRTASASGPLAATFEHGFSTKPLDPETGLHYYGYRFYATLLGRWMNRDPIGELESDNLLSFYQRRGKETQGVAIWTRICYECCKETFWSFLLGDQWEKHCDQWVVFKRKIGNVESQFFASDQDTLQYVQQAINEAKSRCP